MKKRDGTEITPEERDAVIQVFKIAMRTATMRHLDCIYREHGIKLEDSDIKPILQSHAETFTTR